MALHCGYFNPELAFFLESEEEENEPIGPFSS
jgi:hypothetical protein